MLNDTSTNLALAVDDELSLDLLSTSDDCAHSPSLFPDFKFLFVAVIGTSIALISFVENALLFYVFISSRALRKRALIYLTCLSACDIFTSVSYIGIMSVSVLADYFESSFLYIMWHSYLRVFFAISHITLSSSSFLIMAATIERYLQTMRCVHLMSLMGRHRLLIVIIAFMLGTILRGTVFFEIQIVYVSECVGMASMYAALTPLAKDPYYDVIWRFWTRKIATVFVPFFVLAYCNAAIVCNLQRNDRDHTIKTFVLYVTLGPGVHKSQVRTQLRAATRMLIMVVTCYLLANILDVFIAAWENIDSQSLLANYSNFYTIAADISSWLTLVAAAVRLPIYAANDKMIQSEISHTVLRTLHKLTVFCPIMLRSWTRNKCAHYDRANIKLMQQYIVSESIMHIGVDSHEVTAPSFLTVVGSFRRTASMRTPAGGRLLMVRGSVSTNCFIRRGGGVNNIDAESNAVDIDRLTINDHDNDCRIRTSSTFSNGQISSWRTNI